MKKKLNLLLAIICTLAISLINLVPVFADSIEVVIPREKYGYGKYALTLVGTAEDGVKDYDERIFYYYPVISNVTEDDKTGDYILNLDYADEEDGGNVKKLLVEVYDKDGNLIDTIWVDAPTKKVILPPAGKEDLYKAGDIRLEIYAWDTTDESQLIKENKLYNPYPVTFNYEVIPTPDTGSFLRELNISREDYLVTGLIVFGIIAIAGIVFLKKSDTNKKRAHVNAKRRK